MWYFKSLLGWMASLVLSCSIVAANDGKTKQHPDKLRIEKDRATGRIVLTWGGNADLAHSHKVDRDYTRIRGSRSPYYVEPAEDVMHYRLTSPNGAVYSVNAVGYVNVFIPTGLSLWANPLENFRETSNSTSSSTFISDNTVSALFQTAPNGAQVFKFVEGSLYEISTYTESAWSNPDMTLLPGEGFFFSNPDAGYTHTFIGQVLEGCPMINPIPAGYSTKGSLVPMHNSINTGHHVPGEPGDILRIYYNDGSAEGFATSIFSATENAWVPDLQLGVARGLWISKQRAQDWTWCFDVTP